MWDLWVIQQGENVAHYDDWTDEEVRDDLRECQQFVLIETDDLVVFRFNKPAPGSWQIYRRREN